MPINLVLNNARNSRKDKMADGILTKTTSLSKEREKARVTYQPNQLILRFLQFTLLLLQSIRLFKHVH